MFFNFFKFGKNDKMTKKNPITIKLIDRLSSIGKRIAWNNTNRKLTFIKT